MFGRKCSLCGGKLDGRNICKECGLDNTKSEKYYKINQSNCDDRPLTHVHEESSSERKTPRTIRNKSDQPKYSYQQRQRPKKGKSGKGKLSVLVSVISVLAIIIPAVFGIIGSFVDSSFISEDTYTVELNPYEYLEKEHPMEGDSHSCTLKAGQYIVGVHIPEGDYCATTFDDFDTVEVMDDENGIFLYEYQAKEEGNYLDDLRLFNGAVVTITSMEGILLRTDNAQFETQVNEIENPVKDTYELNSEHEVEAGEDFEAGVYDIIVEDEYTYIHLTVYDENGEQWDYRSIDMGSDGCDRYNNLVIPEGAILYCEGGSATLIPSEMIASTDYLEFYY